MTTGEIITRALSYYSSAGSPTIAEDLRYRQRAHFFLTKVGHRVDQSAPNWWRNGDGSVVLSAGIGTLPTDFNNPGEKMRVYVSGSSKEVILKPAQVVKQAILTSPMGGEPSIYCLDGRTSLGLPKILCWPSGSVTLLLKNYMRKMPELVDAPLAPVASVSAVVGLPSTGPYTYRITNVSAAGETEGGNASASVTSAGLLQINLTSVRTWWERTVTSRKVYRNATGSLQYKLVGTISDNLATTFTDNIADGSLGANIVEPSTAITGMEYFPEDFHDSTIYDGLVYQLANSQGDGRTIAFDAKWEKAVRDMWDEHKPGRNAVNAFPAFPNLQRAGIWDRFSRPD